jgi:DNA-directed RNA polymerase specialized sigma24 family protein
LAAVPGTSPIRVGAGNSETRTLAAASEIEAFYRELFLPLVRRAIRRYGLSNEDARDVVQEAFVLALVKMENEGNAIAWLKKVVDFLAVNLKRTANRRAGLLAKWQVPSSQDRRRESEEF